MVEISWDGSRRRLAVKLFRVTKDIVFRAVVLSTLIISALIFSWDYPDQKQEYNGHQESQRHREDPEERRIADYNFWLMVFTGVLGAVAITQLIFISRSDKTARITARAAFRAAIAAQKQVAIASAQTDEIIKQKSIMRLEYIATHRPRLKVRYIKYVIRDSITYIQFRVVNIGESDADITSNTISVLHKKSIRRVHQLQCFRLTGGEGKTVEYDLANTFDDTFDLLTLKVRGMIEYSDEAHIKRRTAFAGIYDAKSDWFRRSSDPEEEYED
jgi:hypothetical protein